MAKQLFIFTTLAVYMFICYGFELATARRPIQTNRPIIGVMAQSTRLMPFEKLGKTYIPASYIKFLESSGARVVPILSNLTEVGIKKLFNSINGVVFPGGNETYWSSGYAKTAKMIFDLAKKTFDEGDYFPIIGMCHGHQILVVLIDGQQDIIVPTDSYNMTAPLNLPVDYRKTKLFGDIPKDLVKPFNETLITAHFHHLSIPVKSFQENKKAKDFYRVLTTNIDRNGMEFVSTMEAKKYPFYSTQWHPEKNPFEWPTNKTVPHNLASIKLSQYISNFFVQEARLSKHKFASEEEEKAALIYNYFPVHTGKNETLIFDQIYFFG